MNQHWYNSIQDKVGVVTTGKPAGVENQPTKSHQQLKPKYKKEAHTNGRMGNPRASRHGAQRDHTIESQRTPTTEVTP